MLYNKRQNQKVNSKKVLHKVKKHWVTISTALLMALGGVAAFSSSTVYADVNGGQVHGNDHLQSGSGQMTSPLRQDSVSNVATVASRANQLHSQILQSGLSNAAHNSSVSEVNSAMSVKSGSRQINQSSASQRNVVPNVELGSSQSLSSVGSLSSGQQGTSLSVSDNDAPTVGDNASDDSDDYSKVMVRYEEISDGNRIVGFEPPSSDTQGAPFSSQGFENLCPHGFHVVKTLNPVSVYPPAGQTSVLAFGVKKNHVDVSYNKIEIRYVDVDRGNIMIHSQENLSDYKGAPFNIKQFTSNIPNGYVLDTALQPSDYLGVPGILSNPGHITNQYIPGVNLIQIGVKDATSPNANKDATVTINYVSNNGEVLQNRLARGKMSQSFNLTPFESVSSMPSGYQFAGRTSAVPSHYSNQTVDLYVEPVPKQFSKITVDYQTSDGHTVGSSSDIGKIGNHFNAKQYQILTPDNYQFVKFLGNVPQTFTDQDGHLVALVKSTQPTLVNMTINYQEDGETVGVASTSGQSGQPFYVNQYEHNVPAGFKFAGVNYAPKVYQNGSSVDIAVKRIPQAPKNVQMKIDYINAQDLSVVDKTTASGEEGSSFDVSQYRNHLPAGYVLKKVSDNAPSTYQDGATVDIYVTPSTKPQQVAHMMVNYLYQGSVKGTASATGVAGSPFTQLGQYENNAPSGYHFQSVEQNTVPATYQNGHVINIELAPDSQPQQVAHMMVSYYADGQNIGGATITGVAGHQFTQNDLHQYLINLPAGYNSPKISGKLPTTYQDGKTINIDVQKDAPAMGKINIEYLTSNGVMVGNNEIVAGVAGSHFNLAPYKNNLPSGYHLDKVLQGQDVNSFNDGQQTVILQVDKDQPDGVIDVSYVNSDHQTVGNPITLQKDVGSSFGVQDYQNAVPSGYHLTGVIDQGGNIHQFYAGTQNVMVQVAKNQSRQQLGSVMVVYFDPNGNSVGKNERFNGRVGTSFDMDAQKQDVPQGYHFVKILHGANVSAYQPNLQLVQIEVAKTQNSSPQLARMNVDYYNGSHKIESRLASGVVGQPFNLQTYEQNVPAGYRFDYVVGRVPQNYVNGEHMVIMVSPNHQKVQMSVEYRNGSQVLQNLPINGDPGQAFDFNSFKNNVPAGYHYVSAQNVPVVFQNGDQVIINVAANQTASDSANNNSNHGNPTPSSNNGGQNGNHNPSSNGNNSNNNHRQSQPNGSPKQSKENHSGRGNSNSSRRPNQQSQNGKGSGSKSKEPKAGGKVPQPQNHQGSLGPGGSNGSPSTSGQPSQTYHGKVGSTYRYQTSQKRSTGQSSNGQRLPQTGEASSQAKLLTAMLSLFSLMFFGVGLIDRKKKRN